LEREGEGEGEGDEGMGVVPLAPFPGHVAPSPAQERRAPAS